MKKFKLFLLAAVAVLPVLQSCNDSDVEGADSMALVTILNPGGLSGTFYFKADNGQTLYPSAIRRTYRRLQSRRRTARLHLLLAARREEPTVRLQHQALRHQRNSHQGRRRDE